MPVVKVGCYWATAGCGVHRPGSRYFPGQGVSRENGQCRGQGVWLWSLPAVLYFTRQKVGKSYWSTKEWMGFSGKKE